MTLLVDDQLLSRFLRQGELPGVLGAGEAVYTTGYWYVRLCQAVLGVADRPGVLSAPFASLPPGQREQALAAVVELPAAIGMLSLRQLGPLVARLRATHQLNILSIEALAAALHLRATVVLSTRSPRLEAALEAESCRFAIDD